MSPREFDPSVREQMDLDQPITPELERDLVNLVTLNRLFGSHALVIRFLRRAVAAQKPRRILDLATGSGDIPRTIAGWAARSGIEVSIDAVDQQPSTLEIARRLSGSHPNISYHQGDIREFGSGSSWDIVLCSLALHHFSEADAVTVLRHAASLARHCVLVADLRRCSMGTFGVDLLTTIWMREPMTRNDARISVRRAFSFTELAGIARSAGWRDYGHARRFCFRQAIWIDRTAS